MEWAAVWTDKTGKVQAAVFKSRGQAMTYIRWLFTLGLEPALYASI